MGAARCGCDTLRGVGKSLVGNRLIFEGVATLWRSSKRTPCGSSGGCPHQAQRSIAGPSFNGSASFGVEGWP